MSSPKASKALAKRSGDSAIMPPPPPPPKRIKRPSKVLDEDTYTEALSHIIARDFFPGLLETQSQQEYLDALESKDNSWIADAGRRLTQVMTPGPEGRRIRGRRGTSMARTSMAGTSMAVDMTPQGWSGETPMSVVESEPGVKMEKKTTTKKNPDVDLLLSLSAFQTKYTSEDNESFNSVLDKQNTKRAEKHAWMYHGNKILAPRQIAHRAREAKLLEAAKDSDSLTLYKTRDTRPAMPNHQPVPPRNSLMFNPDSVEDTHETVAQASEARSNAPPKAIVYDNTRVPIPRPAEEGLVLPSPSMSAIDAAIARKHRPSESSVGSETPRVAGYPFVDAEPTPSELQAFDSGLVPDPGDILARLAPSDPTPNPFTIKEAGKREILHHKMVEKSLKSRRTGVGRVAELMGGGETPGRTPTPKFASAPKKNPGILTPAAQKLLGRIGTPVTRSSGSGVFDTDNKRENKARWTPAVTPKP